MSTADGTRVLHLCSDFARQSIYNNLVAQLDRAGVSQLVYVPVRTAAEIGVNATTDLPRTQYRYAHVLRPLHRVFFGAKVRRVLRDLQGQVNLATFDVVHAHFLYSDGAVALRIKQQFGTPYVVAVRNTDVNAFMRLRPDLLPLCCEILRQARSVVFITPAYVDRVLQRLPPTLRQELPRNVSVIPNGLPQFWLDHPPPAAMAEREPLKLLYVGDFSRNKNIANAMRATALLRARRQVELTLVGAGGDGEAEVASLLASGQFPFVRRLGRIADPQQLLAAYREHDVFVMPSILETFGVAYLEALSQGLPIVHTRGQGVDGYFGPGTVAEPVDPGDPADIAAAIERLAGRLSAVRSACVERAGSFAWSSIARTYLDLYGSGPVRPGSERVQ
jgi:glycosyltransferase involved in cell wall biosynthesis